MTQVSTVNDAIEQHLESPGFRATIPVLQRMYQEHDYAEFSPFLPAEVWRTALGELEELFDSQARRRDLVVKQSGNTPRKYSNLDRDSLAAGSTVIPAVFQSPALYRVLEEIVGEKVLPVPYVPEEYIAARLHKPGDVHGWHWDDYTFALVWVFKMPDAGNGGSLEYIPRVPWNREDPQVDQLVAQGPVLRRHPTVGSAYLLKADTALHRVAPLRYEAERMIVCFTFATVADLEREVDHDSMEALYPESHDRHHN